MKPIIEKRNAGFTLLEIMLALLIFALLAVITAVGLNTVISNEDTTSKFADKLSRLQIAMTLLQRDTQQLVNRPIIDRLGRIQPALMNTIEGQGFEFTHMGYSNPNDFYDRSTLRRVTYKLVDSQLIRESWWVLDQAPNSEPITRVLLDGVADFSVNYIDEEGIFRTQWLFDSETLSLPNAITIDITFVDQSKLSRVFYIASRGYLGTEPQFMEPSPDDDQES